jgi:hypothetical protein
MRCGIAQVPPLQLQPKHRRHGSELTQLWLNTQGIYAPCDLPTTTLQQFYPDGDGYLKWGMSKVSDFAIFEIIDMTLLILNSHFSPSDS